MPSSPQRSRELGLGVVRALASAHSGEEATRAVLAEVAGGLGAPLAIVWKLDPAAGLLRWAADWSDRPELHEFRRACRRLSFGVGLGLPGRVVERLEPARIDDLAADREFPRADIATRAGLRSAIAAPLVGPGGALGAVEVLSDAPADVLAEGLPDLATAARQLAAYLAQIDAEERLRASAEEIASIFAAALDGVIVMDHAGRIVDVNPAAENIFGFVREDAVGDLLAERIVPPDLREAHREALQRYVDGGPPKILNRRLELTGLRADGTVFPVELAVTRLGTSEPPTFAGFLRDITARHAAEAEHERLLAEAEAARRRLELLSRAGERMLTIQGYDDATRQIVDLAIPDLADWCLVAVSSATQWRTVAGAHRDRARSGLVAELMEHHAPAADATAVLASGRTEVVAAVSEADLRRLAVDEAHLEVLRRLEPSAIISVPLRTPARVFGTLTLVMAESGRTFQADDIALAESLAARSALALENARLLTERSHIADTLQRGLLPARLPVIPGLDVAARYRAAGGTEVLVGGDFYDVFGSGPGEWTAILGDVSGKGPAAAAVTALTRHTLRAAALRGAGPAESLRLLNDALLAGLEEVAGRFATVVHGRVTPGPEGVDVLLSAGGQPPPLIRRADGGIERVDVPGTLIGAIPAIDLCEVKVHLRPGDALVLYTDGVTEIRTDDPSYGERLLDRVVAEHAASSADVLAAALEDAVVAAQAGDPRDDIALVVLRVP